MTRRRQRQQEYREHGDDHVIHDVETVHIERLDENTIWIGLYLADGRVVFQVVGAGEVRLIKTEGPDA